jgi:cytochrome c peroxidase
LGSLLFFDTNLSTPPGQSCATCHDPSAGFADPDSQFPVLQGVHTDRFGSRNTPTVAYAALTPEFQEDSSQNFIGGQFLDGRAVNLAEQAKLPFLNPLEMANPDKQVVVEAVRAADYAGLFVQIYGEGSLDDVESAYNQIADALAAFQGSDEISPFTSKFDAFLAGQVDLTDQERQGFILFDGKGQCFSCHRAPLLTDHTYSNLGVPKNPDNPFYDLPLEFNPDGAAFVDLGLAANPNVLLASENGKFKVPTLRNVAITPPYMHNGVFQTLEEVVNFYNTRDVLPQCDQTGTSGVDCWPAPEVADNVDILLMGNLGLTPDEVDDIVAFLTTLTDGFFVL